MGPVGMLVASLAISTVLGGVQASAANKAEAQQQAARSQAAKRKVSELERQQKEADLVAQEQKSDRARETDKQVAEMLALQADTGATGAAIARLGGEFAGIGGLDIARIESNRASGASARHAESISIIGEKDAANAESRSRQSANTLKFFGDTALSAVSTASKISSGPTAKGPISTSSRGQTFTDFKTGGRDF